MGMTITLCLGVCTLNTSPCIFKGALALHVLQGTPFGMGGWCSWAVWAARAGVVITPFAHLRTREEKMRFLLVVISGLPEGAQLHCYQSWSSLLVLRHECLFGN